MIDASNGRVVNVSSGAAMMYLKEKPWDVKKFYANPETTWEQLVAEIEKTAKKDGFQAAKPWLGVYGLSKVGLNLITIHQSKAYSRAWMGPGNPNIKVTSISPGFINTNMTAGFGSKLTPDHGTVSTIKCLFGDVVSGAFYGSDGRRSPLTITRDPGCKEYEGEDESTLEWATYNNRVFTSIQAEAELTKK